MSYLRSLYLAEIIKTLRLNACAKYLSMQAQCEATSPEGGVEHCLEFLHLPENSLEFVPWSYYFCGQFSRKT